MFNGFRIALRGGAKVAQSMGVGPEEVLMAASALGKFVSKKFAPVYPEHKVRSVDEDAVNSVRPPERKLDRSQIFLFIAAFVRVQREPDTRHYATEWLDTKDRVIELLLCGSVRDDGSGRYQLLWTACDGVENILRKIPLHIYQPNAKDDCRQKGQSAHPKSSKHDLHWARKYSEALSHGGLSAWECHSILCQQFSEGVMSCPSRTG